MKVNQEFVLRRIAENYVLVPIVNTKDDFNGIITLNEIGAYIWNKIEENSDYDSILKAIVDEYDVEKNIAKADLDEFINNFKTLGIIC